MTGAREPIPRIYAHAAELARAAAEYVVTVAEDAVAARGQFTVALAGGSTPRATYALLANDEFVTRMNWQHTHVFWGDERCVPPDHPDSNYRMACEALLYHVSISTRNVHRIQGELNPEQAASIYQDELRAVLGTDGRFDLILLGMGADGHTASLFPGTTALEERERAVVAVYVERTQSWRVTLTLPVINAARHVLFLVSGKAKAAALAQVNAGEPLPASLVQPSHGQLTWMVDRDAAHTRE
ncbi:MAG: 6-phosphogluconolactonase [Anaerolineae bacterium]